MGRQVGHVLDLLEGQFDLGTKLLLNFEPSGQNLLAYKTTLTVDQNGDGELILSSEDAMPGGEVWVGEYLVRAIGYEGSYAETQVIFE